MPTGAFIIDKGTSPLTEAYSGFQGTDLKSRLAALGTIELFIGGLATDYCVKETSLDAVRAGFEVNVIEDCVKAVETKAGDGSRALDTIRNEGVRVTTSDRVLKRMAGAQQ